MARNRPFLALTLLNVPVAFGYMVLSVSLPVYVTQELDQPSSLVGVLYAVNTVGIAVLQIPVTRLLTRYRRTRSGRAGRDGVRDVVRGGTPSWASSRPGTALVIGVFVATAAFTVGELMHGARPPRAMVASAGAGATRGRHLAVYQLSWAVPTALAPAVLTGLLTASPTGMWLVLATAVGGAAAGVLRLEPRLPRAAVAAGNAGAGAGQHRGGDHRCRSRPTRPARCGDA
ncbi:hypothetical protein GCM10020358_52040 [Amorphoplanes nipponensis]|uniref:hypothetical protein n=1 Tax=Actinoplanes nipponensis TaxID=135950 RepID=UPI0031EAC489